MDKRKKLSPVFHKAVHNSGSAPPVLPLGINRQIHSYSIFALILCSPAGKAGRIRKRQEKSARQERRCRALFIGCFQSKTGFEEIHRQGSHRDGERWGGCPNPHQGPVPGPFSALRGSKKLYSNSSYDTTRQSVSYSLRSRRRLSVSTSPFWLSYGSRRRKRRGGVNACWKPTHSGSRHGSRLPK